MKRNTFGLFAVAALISTALTIIWTLSPLTETNVSAQKLSTGWKVWVKTHPCSTDRQDWIRVAEKNPTPFGPSYFTTADLIEGTMVCKRDEPFGCAFDVAMAEAETLRPYPQYNNYCCKDYSVWENNRTKEKRVVKGMGDPGFGWNRMPGPNLCMEAADALAGTSRGGFGPATQTGLQGTTLIFYPGTTPEKCQADCSANPKCKAFSLIKAGFYNRNDPPMCYLISEVTVTAPSDCCLSAMKSGTTISKEKTPVGEKPCTAAEQEAFTAILGRKWKHLNGFHEINIGGSCENVRGTSEWEDYCGGARKQPNFPSYMKVYQSTFTGRMSGKSLVLKFTSTDPRSASGTGYCELRLDWGSGGTKLSCASFPCG